MKPNQLVYAALFIAVLPLPWMMAAAKAYQPWARTIYIHIHLPDTIRYDRCVPDPPRGQNVDGSTMFWRDERIRLSQCWEDT